MGKKNLDKLFQEKFKGFSEAPDQKVWERISLTLDEKKKSDRIIPLWWKIAGAAAVLALLVLIANPFENDGSVEDPGITDIQNPVDQNTRQNKKDAVIDSRANENKVVASDNNKSENTPQKDSKGDSPSGNTIKGNTLETAPSEVAKGNNKKQLSNDLQSNQLATSDKNTPKNNDQVGSNFENKTEATLSATPDKKEEAVLAQHIEKNNPSPEGVKTEDAPEKEDNKRKKSIFDAIAENETEADDKTPENSSGKWAIGANIAPVYFNSLGEGSPIHSSFVANSKSGDIKMSYGLSVSYQISKKLRIRSGIGKVDYGYNTNNVEFSSSFFSSTNGEITNIDYNTASANLVVESSNTKADNSLTQKEAFVATARNGEMAQQFGYLEIPMELNYALVDRRFGINLIGGLSSLFLIDNAVVLNSGELTTDVGRANNINDVNFSTNIGFGLKYELSPKIQMNIEPVFKYQLNTFSNTSGNFQPFSVGVYSGLNFRF